MSPRVTAKYRTVCGACARPIEKGVQIRKGDGDGWVHAPNCEPREVLRQVHRGDLPPLPASKLPEPLPPKRRRPDPPWVRARSGNPKSIHRDAIAAYRAQWNNTLVLHENTAQAQAAGLEEQLHRVNTR